MFSSCFFVQSMFFNQSHKSLNDYRNILKCKNACKKKKKIKNSVKYEIENLPKRLLITYLIFIHLVIL